MSTEVGLRTQYLNWKTHFPKDRGIEPTWVVVTFEQKNGWIERLPGIPRSLKSRIRAYIEVGDGLKKGPFDSTLVAVHSALASRPAYTRNNATFVTFDVTPKQLQDFGSMYGKHASQLPFVEKIKHVQRAASYQQCRGLFPWSQWAKDSVVNDYGASPDQSYVIPPGVDLEAWRPKPGRSDGGTVDLLFVGGHFERKGGRLLLEWARTTATANWRLHIVTNSALDCGDSRITVYNGLTSNTPELKALYEQADLFVLPTLADCYSIAGIEAMASGLPVLLGHIGGTGDVVQDGKTGFLLAPGRQEELDEKLELLISDSMLRRQMGAAARNDCEQRFDVRKNIDRTLDVMEANS